jgi:hypothetical protein
MDNADLLLAANHKVYVQFLWNFFISEEAVAAERRYEKETSTCMQVAFRARTYLLSPLPLPPHTRL